MGDKSRQAANLEKNKTMYLTMPQIDWKKLHNGSDILGVALDRVRGDEVNFTPEVAERLGRAFVVWLQTYFQGRTDYVFQ